MSGNQGVLFERGMYGTFRPAPPPPAQPASATSQAGARAIRKRRSEVQECILRALRAAGQTGLTIAELAEAVTRERGQKTTEGTICGRICGVDPELEGVVVNSGRLKRNESGVEAMAWVLKEFA